MRASSPRSRSLLAPGRALHAQARRSPTTLTLQEAIQHGAAAGTRGAGGAQHARRGALARPRVQRATAAAALPLRRRGEPEPRHQSDRPARRLDAVRESGATTSRRSGSGSARRFRSPAGRVTVGSEVSRIDEFGEPDARASIRRRRSSCSSSRSCSARARSCGTSACRTSTRTSPSAAYLEAREDVAARDGRRVLQPLRAADDAATTRRATSRSTTRSSR